MKLNLATKITLARIALLPFIAFFYIGALAFANIDGMEFFVDYGRLIALVLFIIAAVTDFIDGKIARYVDPKTGKNTVTGLGNLLDTVADKLLIMLGLILLVADPIWYPDGLTGANTLPFPYWFAVLAVFIMIARDFIITLVKSISKEKLGTDLLADKLGKIKFVMQLVAISLYMLFAFNLNPSVSFLNEFDNGVWFQIFQYACVFIMAAAVVISVMSCVNYITDFASKLRAKEQTETKESEENGDRNNEK